MSAVALAPWVCHLTARGKGAASSLLSPQNYARGPTLQPFLRCSGRAVRSGHRLVGEESELELPLRMASNSLSIILDLGLDLLGLLSPLHSREASLCSLTTSLTASCNSPRLNCNGTFQCHSINEPATPRSRSSDRSGGGCADHGVSS